MSAPQDEAVLDLLFVSAERFRAKPQVGVPVHMTWGEIHRWLSHPTIGDAKDMAGGYSLALYTDGIRRKANVLAAHALVVDVDESGDVDQVADAVAVYDAIVHETFTSTREAPRCRLLLRLATAIDVATYDQAHAAVRAHLRARSIQADDGAKDASRLSYCPVRRRGAGYRFRVTTGRPVDAAAVIAAQPPPPPRPVPRLPDPPHADGYIRAALRRGADSVAGASAGERHYCLSREAFTLARLGLAEHQIEDALLPAFVAAAGDPRRHEGERTIRDAVRARRAA